MRPGRLHRADAGIRAREPDRRHADGRERRDEPRVNHTGQHADDDVERRLVGDAQPIYLALFDAGACKRRIDFAAAAMHDNKRRGSREPCQRRRERREPRGLLQQLAAKFHHDRRSRSSDRH